MIKKFSTIVAIITAIVSEIIILIILGINFYNQRPIYHYVNMANQMQYTSQFKPKDIPGGCEAASLKMALSIKGKARNIQLYQLINKIGWYNRKNGHNGNPNIKYSNNPYYSGNEATMYPQLMIKWAKYYHVPAQDLTNAKKKTIIKHLIHHQPLIVEAGHDMQHHWYDDHILCLIGYKNNKHGKYVEYTDSLYNNRYVKWTTFNQFWTSYNRPKTTGKRAIAIE